MSSIRVMMSNFLDKVLTVPVLIGLNIVIIILTETVGGGEAFEKYGIIHAIAVVFILLAATRMAKRYYIVDPEVRAFIVDGLIAMGFFAAAHLIEFISFAVAHLYTDQAYAAVVNMYSISLLFLVMGSEYVIKNYKKKSSLRIWICAILAGVLVGLTVATLMGRMEIDLELDEAWAYIYLVLVLGTATYGIFRINQIAGLYPWFLKFIRPLRLSIIMIVIAAVANVLYEPLVEDFHLPEIQLDYLTHFTFYAALSVMILAYGKPLKVGGIHEDVRRELEALEREEKLGPTPSP